MPRRKTYAAPAAPALAVHFAPALAVYAALSPVIRHMAPALVLADFQQPPVPFVQGSSSLLRTPKLPRV